MSIRIPRAARCVLALASLAFAASAHAVIEIQWWHAMTAANNDRVNALAKRFNESQNDYHVTAVFKGTYPEAMASAIAAFRAGNAPHILQVFEVGTATMMSAKGAIKPVYEVMAESGEKFDPKIYVPAVASYYTNPKGQMLSFPFNSSTTVFWYNKDAFKKAGLDPSNPPKTWRETREAARKIRASNATACGFTVGWPTWTQFEQFSAIHNVPLATKANGMDGMDTELKINSPLHVRHIQTLLDMQKEGSFKYGGRDNAAEALFPSGECAIIHTSSAFRARVVREAKFDWGVAMLP
jgi:sn-glycerol 3-phosphate transport system substrate-binding protein